MQTFSFLRNVVDIRADGQTAYTKRYGEDFNGVIIPSEQESSTSRAGNMIRTRWPQWATKWKKQSSAATNCEKEAAGAAMCMY